MDMPFYCPPSPHSHPHSPLLFQHQASALPLGLGPISSFPLYSKVSSICLGSQSLVSMVLFTISLRRPKSLHANRPLVVAVISQNSQGDMQLSLTMTRVTHELYFWKRWRRGKLKTIVPWPDTVRGLCWKALAYHRGSRVSHPQGLKVNTEKEENTFCFGKNQDLDPDSFIY